MRSLPELYRLTKDQLMELEGYGEISATNAVESIEASKQVPWVQLWALALAPLSWRPAL